MAALSPAEPRLGASLLALLALTHAQEAQRLGLVPTPAFSTTLDSLQARRAFYLGAWVGPTLVGALALGPDDEPGQLAVQTLVVHPDHQRQGHGLALLQQAQQRTAGLTLAVVVGAANTAAVALYRGQGFVVVRQGWLAPEVAVNAGRAPHTAAPPTDTGVLVLKMRRSQPLV